MLLHHKGFLYRLLIVTKVRVQDIAKDLSLSLVSLKLSF